MKTVICTQPSTLTSRLVKGEAKLVRQSEPNKTPEQPDSSTYLAARGEGTLVSRSSQSYALPNPAQHSSPMALRILGPARSYVTHLPINDPMKAKVLSRQVAWDILSHIRASGSNGVSAGDISTSMNIPLGDVYSTLRDFTLHELAFKVPRTTRLHRGRRKRYVSDKITWKSYTVDRGLTRILEREGILKDLTERLREPFLMALTQAKELLSKTEFNSQLPWPGKAGLCHRCGMNHEALDFFNALLMSLGAGFMEGEAFKTFFHNLGFSDRN